MKVICPKCKKSDYTKESGISINSVFRDGRHEYTERTSLDVRYFCDNCHDEIWIYPRSFKMDFDENAYRWTYSIPRTGRKVQPHKEGSQAEEGEQRTREEGHDI